MSEQRKATYKEIAKIAKVSISTVARVASGNGRVDPELQKQVLNAAHELRADLAQRPRKRHEKVIAFLHSNRETLHPFHSQVLVGAEAACMSQHYSMLFHCLHYPGTKIAREIYLPPILEDVRRISGFILAGANFPNLLDTLSRRRMPFVVLGNNVVGEWESDRYDVVWFNDIQGSHELTRYLQALGHHDIWYSGNCQLPWYARRYEGFRRAMLEAQLEPSLCEFDSTDDRQLGYLSAKSILTRDESVDAIFAGNDLAAQGVCRALKEKGLRVPDDISVAGFDDTESVHWDPPLTSVRIFPEQIGRRMVELLQRRINHRDVAPQGSVVPTQLVKRESCRHAALRADREEAKGDI